MVDVRVICAIGKHGQLGLNGRLPWEGNPGTEYKADVQRFFALTRGHVVIAGPRTIASFPDWARSERTLVEIHSADEPNAILNGNHLCLMSFAPGPKPFPSPIIALLRRKTSVAAPYAMFFVAFANWTYQIFAPCPRQDSALAGKTIQTYLFTSYSLGSPLAPFRSRTRT